jgi:hypothetical protein
MDIEKELLSAIRNLPEEQQREVLDFATFLSRKSQTKSGLRPFGLCAGEFHVPDDFDDPLPDEVIESFNS